MTSELFNIASLLSDSAAKWPDRTAVIAPHRPDVLARSRLTFRGLDESSSHLASYLVRTGVAPGSRIIVLVKPGVDFVSIVFGLFKAGLVPVMVDPGMGLKRMVRCLADGRPSGIIGLPTAHLLTLTAPRLFKSVKTRVTVGHRWGWGGATLREIMAAKPRQQVELPVSTAAGDLAAILFTSGSTGPAKGVLYTHAMFRAQVEAIREGFDLQEGGVDLATFPLFALFSPALGLTSVIADMNSRRPAKTDPRRILEPIAQHGVTSMFASPTILNKITSYALEHNLTLPSLRRVMGAGAPVSPRLVASFSSLMGDEGRLMTPYGATEGVPLTCIAAEEITTQTNISTEQGLGMCVGTALPGVSLGIIKIQEAAISNFSPELFVPKGEIGEIIAKGDMVSPAYFERPKETSLSIIMDKDGSFWRRMGDVGWLDSRGRLWFCGRKAHRVLTEHGVLFSIPCEAIFNNHPQVRRSALVGVAKGSHQQPVIIIEPKSPLKGDAWRSLVEELNSLAKTNSRTIHINTFLKHRSFPVDVRHNAKIDREKLTQWATIELLQPLVA